MTADINSTRSWSETLDQLSTKHQKEAEFNSSQYLRTVAENAQGISDLEELVEVFKLLRKDLDTSNIHKDLKIQIMIDILEVVFKLYEEKSIRKLLPQLLTIFNPLDYARQVFYKIESKLEEYQNEET